MNIEKRLKDAAVSPVVGVLLMLVITIIIAAVVSGFAGGLVENKAKTPQVVLDVTINAVKEGSEDGLNITIRHLSGDPINTVHTELITSWMEQDIGNPTNPPTIHYAKTVPIDAVSAPDDPNTPMLNLQQPYLVKFEGDGTNPIISPTTGIPDEDLSWGRYIMKVGDVAKVDSDLDNSYDGSVIADFTDLTRNHIVTVRLIDSITGGLIYEKDVTPVFNVGA